MRKDLPLACLLFVFSFLVLPTSVSASGIDSEIGRTIIGTLGNASEKTVEGWLKGILSKSNIHPSLSTIGKFKFKEGNKDLVGFDPGFDDWLYAVVKYGEHLIAFTDNNDGLLTTGLLSHAVSNVTFFAKAQAPAPDSEPTTILLLSVGLIGLVGLRRRFKIR